MRLEKVRKQKSLSRKQVHLILRKKGIEVPATFLRDLETTGMSRHLGPALPELVEIYGVTISSVFGKSQNSDRIIQLAESIARAADQIKEEAR